VRLQENVDGRAACEAETPEHMVTRAMFEWSCASQVGNAERPLEVCLCKTDSPEKT
jgi:hypothetical protein